MDLRRVGIALTVRVLTDKTEVTRKPHKNHLDLDALNSLEQDVNALPKTWNPIKLIDRRLIRQEIKRRKAEERNA